MVFKHASIKCSRTISLRWRYWRWIYHRYIFCLFGVYHLTREFFTNMETTPLPVKAVNFDLCSTLISIEQWGFLNVPHLLWNRPTLHNGHPRGPMTLTLVAERLAGAVTICVYDLGLSQPKIEPRSPACEANVQPLHHLGYILNDKIQKDLMQTLFYWLKKQWKTPKQRVFSTSNEHCWKFLVSKQKKYED